jgi:hypothetical protein
LSNPRAARIIRALGNRSEFDIAPCNPNQCCVNHIQLLLEATIDNRTINVT